MVVPLIVLGAATKLAFAVAATYRTRWWWCAGTAALALGGASCLHDGATRTVGAVSIVLGAVAVAAARCLRVRS
jgi:hypothetical protein